jgi:hypothetical protein
MTDREHEHKRRPLMTESDFIAELTQLLERCPEGLPIFVMRNIDVRSEHACPIRQKDIGVVGLDSMTFVETALAFIARCRFGFRRPVMQSERPADPEAAPTPGPDDKPRPPVSMILDYPFRGRTQHDANLAATRASAAATYWKRVAREAEARVRELEGAIRVHRDDYHSVGANPEALWGTLSEEASDA